MDIADYQALMREIARLTERNERLSKDNARYRKRVANLQKQRDELRGKLFDQTLVEVQKRHQRMSAAVRQS
ncbi:hypothetical protein [Nocardia africana]